VLRTVVAALLPRARAVRRDVRAIPRGGAGGRPHLKHFVVTERAPPAG